MSGVVKIKMKPTRNIMKLGIWKAKPLLRSNLRTGMPVHLFGDKDKDRVANVFDCRPRNKWKQDEDGKLKRFMVKHKMGQSAVRSHTLEGAKRQASKRGYENVEKVWDEKMEEDED